MSVPNQVSHRRAFFERLAQGRVQQNPSAANPAVVAPRPRPAAPPPAGQRSQMSLGQQLGLRGAPARPTSPPPAAVTVDPDAPRDAGVQVQPSTPIDDGGELQHPGGVDATQPPAGPTRVTPPAPVADAAVTPQHPTAPATPPDFGEGDPLADDPIFGDGGANT